MSEKIIETFASAMRKAYNLGQTYWQQADSDFVSQHKKADITASRFIELNDQTCAGLLAVLATPPVASGALPELPEPFMELHADVTPVVQQAWADQMRAYGQACAAAAAPNAALAEALKEACDLIRLEVADGEHTEEYRRGMAYLAQAGAA